MYILKNKNGVTKEVKNGFSWGVFLFGFFTPIFRGDWKFASIMFLSSFVGNLMIPLIGAWIVTFIFAFKYNEWYLNDLLEQGYEIV